MSDIIRARFATNRNPVTGPELFGPKFETTIRNATSPDPSTLFACPIYPIAAGHRIQLSP